MPANGRWDLAQHL